MKDNTKEERVIYDNECREYKIGWNACNSGAHFLSNPYSCLPYEGELYRLWQRGYEECHKCWNNGNKEMPKSFTDEDIRTSFSIIDHHED